MTTLSRETGGGGKSGGTRRSPRFRRVPALAAGFVPKAIDHECIRQVGRFGLLSSHHLQRLVGGISADRLLRRLTKCYHAGLIERPSGQTSTMFDGGGSRAMVYTLAPRGARLLVELDGCRPPLPSPDVGRGYLVHQTETVDFLVDLELACRRYPALELVLDEAKRQDEWRTEIAFEGQTRTVYVRPDAVFALYNREAAPERAHRWACLEVDRGSMPITRRDLSQSSITRKLLAYGGLFAEGTFKRTGMTPAPRVLVVTTGAARAKLMVEAFQALASEYGLPARHFLFTDRAGLQSCSSVLAARWLDGAGEERTLLG